MIEKLTRREIAIIFTALLIAAVLVGIITILVEGQKSPTILWLEGVLVGLISATWIRKEVLDTYWQIRDAGGRVVELDGPPVEVDDLVKRVEAIAL
jgi:hypothetical protein